MATKNKSKSKLLTKASAALNGMLVIQLVIMLVLSLVITNTVSKRTKENSIEHMGAITDERAHIIENYVKNAEKTLTDFSKAAQVKAVLLAPDDTEAYNAAQDYTEAFSKDIDDLEGIYISKWTTEVLAHTNEGVRGMVTRKDAEPLKALQDAMLAAGDGVYDTGIIISPASSKQIVSMYKAVYNDRHEPIGLVGLGIFTDGLIATLNDIPIRGVEQSFYSMVNANNNQYIFYSPNAELVGQETESANILSLCEKYKGTSEELTDYFEYRKDGKKYVSIYSYMPAYDWLLMIDDETSEVFALTTTMRIYLGLFALIILGLIIVFNFITKRQALINQKLASALAKNSQTRQSLNVAMFQDVLTEVNNRVSFSMDVETLSPSSKKPIFFVMFNICDFSGINTKFGSNSGDHMLIHTADLLRQYFPNRKIYRTGSDEFVVVVETDNGSPHENEMLANIDSLLRKLLLPEEIKNAGTVYPKYKIALVKTTKKADVSVVTVMKDITNKVGEASHGMIECHEIKD